MRARSEAQPKAKAPLVGTGRPLQRRRRIGVLATCIVAAGIVKGGRAAPCIRGNGTLAKGSSAVSTPRAFPTGVTYTRLGVAVIARGRDTSTALRNVVAGVI